MGLALAAAAGRAFALPPFACFCHQAAGGAGGAPPRCRRPGADAVRFPEPCPTADVLAPLPEFAADPATRGTPLAVVERAAVEAIPAVRLAGWPAGWLDSWLAGWLAHVAAWRLACVAAWCGAGRWQAPCPALPAAASLAAARRAALMPRGRRPSLARLPHHRARCSYCGPAPPSCGRAALARTRTRRRACRRARPTAAPRCCWCRRRSTTRTCCRCCSRTKRWVLRVGPARQAQAAQPEAGLLRVTCPAETG